MDASTTAAIESMASAINRLADAIGALGLTGAPRATDASTPSAAKKRVDAPVMLSAALAEFTGLSSEEAMPRQDAAAKVMKYIKEHGLQDPKDKRRILPDAALAALLGTDQVVNVLNLKSCMKDHFTPP